MIMMSDSCLIEEEIMQGIGGFVSCDAMVV
jgi:hypothetical protein